MVYIYARHAIEEYERWERVHEENAATRAEHGSLGTRAFRPRGEDSEVVVIQEIEDDRLGEMLDYYESEAFRATMDRAGVIDLLEARVLEEVHEMDR